MSAKALLLLGAANSALCVLLGAFGAHALKARLTTDMLTIWETAVQYHFFHALGLLLLGVLALHWPGSALLRVSGWLLLGGIVLFSGSLYLLAVSGVRWLGAITPLGGTAFIAAWVILCIVIVRS